MRFWVLLLLVLIFPVQVLAGSVGHMPSGNAALTATAVVATPHVQMVHDDALDRHTLPDTVDEQRFVAQADIEEGPLPALISPHQMTRSAFIRPQILSFSYYAVPVDVFRPPR